ncbi:MAG: hypothetical protein JO033_27650 [Acidobacteriaceae bacterium]|nr:hypothetical protein [Acidobacteriaceae bacterium]MBV9502530.1 hypothetical protein [Acidobacteriaceae bacterium]
MEAYVTGESGMSNLATLQLPSEITSEIKRLEPLHLDERTVLTLVPKYAQDATPLEIASDYYRGIKILVDNGYLNPDSPFIKETLASLQTYMESMATNEELTPAQLQGPIVKGTNPLSGDLETQIYEAMKVALNTDLR